MGLKMPDGSTLALPQMGDIVHVAFPGRGWKCPAMVLTTAAVKDPAAKLDLLVFNKHTLMKLHLKGGVPHSRFGNGAEPCWSWPS